MNFDIAQDRFGIVRCSRIVDLQNAKNRSNRMPILGHCSFGPIDASSRDLPGCMEPIRISHYQDHSIALGIVIDVVRPMESDFRDEDVLGQIFALFFGRLQFADLLDYFWIGRLDRWGTLRFRRMADRRLHRWTNADRRRSLLVPF